MFRQHPTKKFLFCQFIKRLAAHFPHQIPFNFINPGIKIRKNNLRFILILIIDRLFKDLPLILQLHQPIKHAQLIKGGVNFLFVNGSAIFDFILRPSILGIDKPQNSLPILLIDFELLCRLVVKHLNLIAEPKIEVTILCLLRATIRHYAISHVLHADLVLPTLMDVNLMSVSHPVLVHGLELLLLLN